VAGQPVPQPGAPDAPARPPPRPPACLSCELRSLLDTSNFERHPQNLAPIRRSTARVLGMLKESSNDSEEGSDEDDSDNAEYAHEMVTQAPCI
jgi:hypothetical protein